MKEIIAELFQPVILALVTGGIGAIAAYIRKKLKNEKAKAVLDEVHECLKEGMAEAQERVVRPAKASGKKLDQEAIQSAEGLAIKVAKQVAKGEVLERLESMSSGRLKSTIKQLLK